MPILIFRHISMRSILISILVTIICTHLAEAQSLSGADPDDIMPVRGFCIGAPRSSGLENFIKFIEEELAPRKVNTLILRVDYNYAYESHPELRDPDPLSKEEVGRIVRACRENHIRIIPQVNLLGHQSWAGTVGNLLKVYPEFDETPLVRMPDKYVWPNDDRLYCKSYCPLHPDVHKVVFDIMDEICNVFEADAFHAGMDEVFYIGEEECPRCSGKDKSELFAGEVRTIHDHLASAGRQLWIWGDRLIDGRITGLGEWEASFNDTYRAIDMIPRDIIICDWHYESPEPTPVYFSLKGFSVVTCPWKTPASALLQAQDMVRFRRHATPEMRGRFMGMVQTVWSGPDKFLDAFYGKDSSDAENTGVNCFKSLYDEILRLTEEE